MEPGHLGVEAHERTAVLRGVLLARRELVDVEYRIGDVRETVRRPLGEEEMVSRLWFVAGYHRRPCRIWIARRRLRPFLRPAEAQDELGEITTPAHAVGVGGVLLEH